MMYLQIIVYCWNLTLINFHIVILLSDLLNISVWRLNIRRVGLFYGVPSPIAIPPLSIKIFIEIKTVNVKKKWS